MELFSSAVIQVAIAALIPFIWWAFTARKETTFFHWIGFQWFKPTPSIWLWIVGALLLLAVPFLLLSSRLGGEATATQAFAGKGAAAIPDIAIFAIIQTGLSEELFFRGFLAKRCIARFGLQTGNSIQATIFGLLHLVMVYAILPDTLIALGVGFATMLGALVMAYVNESLADGSILPSWIIHASGNLLAGLAAAFNLFS
ncbi:CPBP family intramembrane glutamic endopeptidase [Stomatohabitans albus]|uniref:CPBP family intramembrane glutamic endopeptidase n=1 Tax=Stomatohabitans albus TaxID=3110766 RepID=UPI00300D3F34